MGVVDVDFGVGGTATAFEDAARVCADCAGDFGVVGCGEADVKVTGRVGSAWTSL